MTLPGAVQAIVTVGSTIWAFNLYLKRRDNIILLSLLGLFLVASGIFIESFSSYFGDTIYDIATFNAQYFHQGTTIGGLGVGLVIGSWLAWLVSLVKK